ncbi:MAG: hypothetical protein A2V88_12375 [Elusimicrobia bacterium RBG_16_66_12]|nr:MAG: hypothetical protein A2V88_12375 [Elusimicrobia bacterium RBG_16_66_12]
MTLAFLMMLAGAVSAAAPRKVVFQTPDGWTLSADYHPPRRGGMVLVLAHGVGSSKREWERFAARLSSEGVGSLAVDLRGHAESTKGPNGERDFKDFDATGEWVKAVADLRAAAAWLEARGVKPSRIAFGGASIGANLASQVSADREKAPCLLLLSPGPDYRGVRLAARPGLKVLVAASPADLYSHQTLEPFSKMKGAETLTTPAGHGVQVFDDARTLDRIAVWIGRCSVATKQAK